MELNAEIINSILEISESYELPQKLMNILLDEERRCLVFEQFLNLNNDLSYDWFTNYFQEGVSNRKKFMQDFTPKSLTKLIPELLPKYESCLDVCAGTGGLTIGVWSKNSNAYFCCEELSGQAFPLLLFNMAIRNMEGQAVNKNVLTGEIIAVYKLFPGKHFSNIIKVDEPEIRQYDICITNPPYSLKWASDESIYDERFKDYIYPPKSKADYAFVLHGLYYLKDGGVMCAILPFGVLFRGAKEGTIRQKLITNGSLKAVIGLPDKLFLNTAIPVCLMFLQKHSRPEPVLIIDASKEFEKKINKTS